jgi:hypothetical protein
MNIKGEIQKHLYRIILIILLLPLFQVNFNFFYVKGLGGYIKSPKDISLSANNWFEGNYQKEKENYLKSSFGFHNWAIRLNHQWAFSIYGMPKINSVIIGKENYLFERPYISTRNGVDYLGDKRLAILAKKAKAVQDTLRALGKAFLFVIAPNKADYLSEFLLDKHKKLNDTLSTNYSVFSKNMRKNDCSILDANAWFLELKDTTSLPLYPKTGIHYSTYGATLVGNRIIKEIESQLGKNLPDFEWETFACGYELRGNETDLEDALNLAFKIPNYRMCYPNIEIKEEGKYKPKSITIGDSYFWQLIELGMVSNIFNNGQFWYYKRDIFPSEKKFAEIDVRTELNNAEVILIIQTPATMKKHLGSFIEVLHNYYYY